MNGPFKKLAVVSSNDPTQPQLTLTLKGEAKPLIALQPMGAYFASVYGEQPQTDPHQAVLPPTQPCVPEPRGFGTRMMGGSA